MKQKEWMPSIYIHTGCSLNNVFFSKILKYIPDSGLSRFPLGVTVCIQWQVKHQHLQSSEKSQHFKGTGHFFETLSVASVAGTDHS